MTDVFEWYNGLQVDYIPNKLGGFELHFVSTKAGESINASKFH
jgi:hypothetical protein